MVILSTFMEKYSWEQTFPGDLRGEIEATCHTHAESLWFPIVQYN